MQLEVDLQASIVLSEDEEQVYFDKQNVWWFNL